MRQRFDVLPGCEPVSHRGDRGVGAVIVHGFTGNPWSMRGVAEAMIADGFDVELPRLPGHGTHVDDLRGIGWSDWFGEIEQAIGAIEVRTDRTMLVGQSMGGTLVLAAALKHPDVAGLMCINPVTKPRDDATIEMLRGLVEGGLDVAPGEGRSDIADPSASDIAYDGTPLRPLLSLLLEGVGPISDRFHELEMPLRLFSSRQDNVVEPADSEHLAEQFGGPVEHTWLERSYHVATLDHDRDEVIAGAVRFAREVSA